MRGLLVACLILGACSAPEVARTTLVEANQTTTTWAAPDQDPGGVTLAEVSATTPQEPPTTTTTEPTTTTTTEPPRPPVTAASRSRGAPNWEALRQCESGGNYSTNTGNGYFGAYQFSLGTWAGLGYGGLPSDALPSTQDEAARRLYEARGATPWPNCGRLL